MTELPRILAYDNFERNGFDKQIIRFGTWTLFGLSPVIDIIDSIIARSR